MFPHTKLKPTNEREQITQTKNEEQQNTGKLYYKTRNKPRLHHTYLRHYELSREQGSCDVALRYVDLLYFIPRANDLN